MKIKLDGRTGSINTWFYIFNKKGLDPDPFEPKRYKLNELALYDTKHSAYILSLECCSSCMALRSNVYSFLTKLPGLDVNAINTSIALSFSAFAASNNTKPQLISPKQRKGRNRKNKKEDIHMNKPKLISPAHARCVGLSEISFFSSTKADAGEGIAFNISKAPSTLKKIKVSGQG